MFNQKIYFVILIFLINFSCFSNNGIFYLSSDNTSETVGYKEIDIENYISIINETKNNSSDIVINRHKNNHSIDWSKKLTIDGSISDKAFDFIIDKDKNIVLVGNSDLFSIVVKINGSNGNIIFSKRIRNKNSNSSNRFFRIYQMNKNNLDDYVVLGMIDYPTSHYLARISKNGDFVWGNEYNCVVGNELTYTLTESNNGDIIIGGHFHNLTDFDHGIIKINYTNGSIIYLKTFNFNNGSAFNGGFDDAVAIPNSDIIVFSIVINSTTLPARNGVLFFNTSSNKIEKVQIYNLNYSSRAISINYLKDKNKLVLGGFVNTNNVLNMILQVIDYNDLSKIENYIMRDLNVNSSNSGNKYISINSNNDILFGGYFKTNITTKAIIGSINLNETSCFNKLSYTLVNVNIPGESNPNFEKLSQIVLQDFLITISSYSFVKTSTCSPKCIATEKLFRLKTIKRIDTICYQQNFYNLNLQITDNQKDTLIKVIAYRKNGNDFIASDSQVHQLNIVFNLPTNFNFIDEWMFIGKTNCSFNDTVFFTLQKHFLNTSLTINDTLFCQNENVEIQSFWSQLKKIPINFNWYDNNTNRLLSNQYNLTLKATENQNIRLEIDDNCAEKNILYTKYQVAPLISDSTIILNKKACQPLKTAFIHPKTIPFNISNTNFKWKWSIDGLNVDSTNSKGGQLEQNKNYTFENAGQFILKAEMVLDNNKICQSYTDSVWVLEKALADFNFNPKVADLTDSIIKFENVSKYASNYRWTISDGNIYLTHSPKHQFPGIGSYNVQLIAYNDANCNDTIEKTYTIYGNYSCFLPNAFSPNGSGINDLWKPYIHAAQSIELLIFNRWGEQIFLSNDINCTWDGSYKNNICQEGIYVYLLKVKSVKGKFFYYKGTIELLR